MVRDLYCSEHSTILESYPDPQHPAFILRIKPCPICLIEAQKKALMEVKEMLEGKDV